MTPRSKAASSGAKGCSTGQHIFEIDEGEIRYYYSTHQWVSQGFSLVFRAGIYVQFDLPITNSTILVSNTAGSQVKVGTCALAVNSLRL